MAARGQPNSEADAASMAYLTDRVLVGEGKPQRYGTQFHAIDGTQYLRPLEAPESLDSRRASVGLPSLAEERRIKTKKVGMEVSLEPLEPVRQQQP